MSELIMITGGTGLIGTNLKNRLELQGEEVVSLSSKDDLRDPTTAKNIFDNYKPKIVYHLAAKVGGIYANNNYKPEFYSDNILINTNVINNCVLSKVEHVFAMGTGCAYPKRLVGSLLKEEDFLDGIPEPTNDAYAYAKRGMLVHLQALNENNLINYTYCLPANIYGAYDNFHPMNSHVVPGLIRRFCESIEQGKDSINIWGDGSAKRDFLYIEDCITAMILLCNKRYNGVVNVSTGILTSINTLAEEIKKASNFNGRISWDTTFPTGQTSRLFDTAKINKLGWTHKTSLGEGIANTVNWFKKYKCDIRER